MLEQLGEHADVVVIDSPALTLFADSTALADVVDSVIVVVRLGRSRRDKFAELGRLLAQRRITPLGFVLTDRHRARGRAVKAPALSPDSGFAAPVGHGTPAAAELAP